MIGGDKRPAFFNLSGAARIVTAVRWMEAQPRSLPGEQQGGPSTRKVVFKEAKVTAITPTSNAPPLKYAIRLGHKTNPSSSAPGTWVDDSGGTDSFAWQEDNGNVPAAVGTYVTVIPGGSDSSTPPVPYYSIVGSPGTFRVYLTQTGGSNGNSTTAVTWTYDVFFDAAKTIKIGSALSPVWARPSLGKFVAATNGVATITTGSTVLMQVDEVYADVKRSC